MKNVNDLAFPEDLRYTDDHEWVRREGEFLVVGISDFAQDQLGDIVYVDLPEEGDTLKKGDEFGTVESVKAVSEMYSPVSGDVVAVNEQLDGDSEQVNTAPYTDGWMIKVKPADMVEFDTLMDQPAYRKMLEG